MVLKPKLGHTAVELVVGCVSTLHAEIVNAISTRVPLLKEPEDIAVVVPIDALDFLRRVAQCHELLSDVRQVQVKAVRGEASFFLGHQVLQSVRETSSVSS